MTDNATAFKRLIEKDDDIKHQLQDRARAYQGDRSDDRGVFDAVVAPVARAVGMPFSYDEAIEAMESSGIELADEALEGIAGGIGMWQRLATGALVTTMLVSMVPTAAAAAPTDAAPVVTQSYVAMPEEYASDFDNDDIATPEGVVATDEGVVICDWAPDAVREAAALSAAAPPGPAGQNDWDRSGKAIDYTIDALGYVSDDAQEVGRYGRVIFNFVKAGCLGDYGAAFGGGTELLKLIGVLQKDPSDISNKQLASEIRRLHALVEDMSDRLDANTRQTYQNRLVAFDNAVAILDIDCQTAETMLSKAAAIADERGEGLIEVEVPTRPVVADPVYPEEPMLILPEEPQLILPDEPDVWSYDAQSDWQEECDDLTAAYVDAMDAWDRDCDEAKQEWELAIASWENTCDQIRAAHETELAQAEAWDEDAAMAEWRAASDAESAAYLRRIVDIAEEQEREGNREFKNFTKTMDAIESNFKLVAVECAKNEGSSPFYAFDSYWDSYFNFETQGWYLRQAYRTNAEYELKRSYALLASYYDIASYDGLADEGDPRESLTSALGRALAGIDALSAGKSPEMIAGSMNANRSTLYYDTTVWCRTLGRSFNRTLARESLASIGIGDHYTDDQVRAYCANLHGRTVAEDLRLAGIMVDYDQAWGVAAKKYLGLGCKHTIEGDVWRTYYVPFDARSYDLRSYDEDEGNMVAFLLNN